MRIRYLLYCLLLICPTLWLAGCFGSSGELGAERFEYHCVTASDPYCDGDNEDSICGNNGCDNIEDHVLQSMPDAIAVGSRFEVHVDPSWGSRRTLRSASPEMLLGQGETFEALEAGVVAIIASHEGWVTDFYHVTLVEPARMRVDRVDVGDTETNVSHIRLDLYETAVLRARVLDSGGQALAGSFACQWTSDATGVVFDTSAEDNLVMISADGSGFANLDVDLGDYSAHITVQVFDASGLGGGGQ